MKKLNDLRAIARAPMVGICRAGAPRRVNAKARSIASRLRMRLLGDDKGQAIVEFALMLPILLMILTGIIGVSFAIFNWQSLNQGTDAAARYLADEGETNNSNGDSKMTDPCSAAFAQITNLTAGLDPSQITVTYTFNGNNIGTFKGTSANTCAGDQSYLGSGNITVTTTYPCNVFGVGVNKIFAGCQLGATKTELSY